MIIELFQHFPKSARKLHNTWRACSCKNIPRALSVVLMFDLVCSQICHQVKWSHWLCSSWWIRLRDYSFRTDYTALNTMSMSSSTKSFVTVQRERAIGCSIAYECLGWLQLIFKIFIVKNTKAFLGIWHNIIITNFIPVIDWLIVQ